MARRRTSKKVNRKAGGGRRWLPALPRVRLSAGRVLGGLVLLIALAVVAPAWLNPPTTWTMWSETRRLGKIEHRWVPISQVAPAARRAIVAAEDANFCLHWGFDMRAIRGALEAGGRYGGSTISQQTVKNVYLWQGRSWPRKALEAVLTPMVELTWSKRRILEVYLNVAEFGEGIFGIDAAARHYFGVAPARLTPAQSAALAVMLPAPRARNATKLTPTQQRRAARISDGAATIRVDGRAACFQS
ncbi:monofunctional biosynthetic peptidoglycan transglycosylase [Rhodovulum strictum]|uniref:Biosynthetic peptidoglycan transglycosylase n=1 Tax=Rhodovulum strictum TaxID=58314 RepID=A0A844BCR2_9RHOB|nr:monofunctional biosynthetic peptidoglycan transglycosylase [Rhodovulum strictum]MRH22254.1 monofunctional biosynthetic peptidoglycan transglycosylase [Rhodovulum strictum]